MKTIALAPNPNKAEAVTLARELAVWLVSEGKRIVLTREVAQGLGMPELGAEEDQLACADLLVVMGGDGTLLRWNRIASPRGILMLGVSFGHYGFITEVTPDCARQAIENILRGDYVVSERVVLEAKVTRGGQVIESCYGLNDIVVSKAPPARILHWHTYINDRFIVAHAADGLIVATPTGSTAYSMSAGGPVIHPDVSVLLVTPICPHTLSARSLVVPDSEVLCIVAESNSEKPEVMLTADGQLGLRLESGDRVEVRKAGFRARLVQMENDSFYQKLTTRLRWGERF